MPLFDNNKDKDKVTNEEAMHMGAADAAWYNEGGILRYVMSYSLCIFIVVLLVWASWAEIDEVSKGMGQVVPSQRVQVIQHLEGGILVDVLVHEGQHVEAEQVVARVDNVGASSIMRDTQTKIREHQAAIVRLEAELDGKEPVFPEELKRDASIIVESEISTYNINIKQAQEEINVIDSQIKQREQELNESISRKNTFVEALNLATQREQRTAPLVAKKLYSEMDYLNLKQEVVRLRGEIDAIANSAAKIEAAIVEAKQRIELSESTKHTERIKELNRRKSELNSLKETLVAGSDRVTRTEMRSPVKGVVNRILINTRGGIVKPGGEIMEIIPFDDSMVIEAKIKPADIAFIHPNQKAVVKITAYDHAIYGSFEGIVENIGADTITNQQGEMYYLIKVRTKERSVKHKDKELLISPGMVATVDVLTGKKTILAYLLKPILKAKDNALRER